MGESQVVTGNSVMRELTGRARHDLPTPALLLDRRVVQENIERMAAKLDSGVSLRPHTKTHKCIEIAKMQIAAGAIGVTTATVWEALAMAQGGLDEILIANQVVGSDKLELLADVTALATVTVAADDERNVRALADVARKRGCEFNVLVEIDVGMNRCGVRSIEAGVSLAHAIASSEGLRFRGVMAYEGHCVLEPDRAARAAMAEASNITALELVSAIEGSGLAVDVVSGGGTGTYDMTGRRAGFTELEAGSYVFMDSTYAGVVDAFEPALTVLATVVSRKGDSVVVDCGTKTVGVIDPPRLKDAETFDWDSSEEHYNFTVLPDNPLDLGDRVEVIPGHCCATVNLHSRYYVIEDGCLATTWEIVARGPGR